MRNKVHAPDDEVIVISGDDKGKRGKCSGFPERRQENCQGINIVSRHVKPAGRVKPAV